MNGDGVTGFVPLAKLRECPLNPRKTFPEESLRELAASMTAQGVLQPLVVRPVPASAKYVKAQEKWEGLDHFEVVAGHRRLKAARMAKLDGLPVLVRRLDDREALAVMVVENAQREGVPPSEEAAALRELVAGMGLEKAAEAVGKPLSAVREREALAGLPAWFLAAVDRGDVSVSTAAVVARVPGEEARKRAAGCVLLGLTDPAELEQDWNDGDEWWEACDGPIDREGVLTQRRAKELVRTHFSRELKGAPFSRTALHLIPDAGSCDACPKRAGNDKELMAEGVRADTCTDPECFAAKVEAYKRVEILKAESKHGALDADLGVSGFEQPPRGWCRLDSPLNQTELLAECAPGKLRDAALTTQVGRLLGDDCPQRYYAFGRGGKLVLLVKTAEARKVLQAAGVLKKPDRRPAEKGKAAPPKPSPKAPKVSDWETKRQIGVETCRLTASILREYGTDNFEDLDALAACGGPETNVAYEALLLVARTVAVDWCAMGSEREAAVAGLLGLDVDTSGDKRWAAVAAKLKGMAPRQLLGFLLGSCGAAAMAETYSGFAKLTDDLLAYAELDRDALESQAARIVAGESSAGEKIDAALAAQEADPLPPGPVVCSPVGAGKLKDIAGLTAQDAACLAAVGLTTLADLERACDAVRAAHSNKDHYAPGVGSQLYEVLRKYPGVFTPGDVTRIGDAVMDHLTVRTSAPAAPAKPAKKGKKKQPA